MMIDITCDQCGKKYRIDEAKLKGKTATFKCKGCQNTLVVASPEKASVPPPRPAPTPPEPGFIETPPEFTEETPPTDDLSAAGEDRKIRFGLAAKVILIMLLVSLLPLALFGAISFKESSDRVRKDTELLMAQIAEGLGNQVDEWIDKNVRVLKTAARLSDIISMDQGQQEPILKAIAQDYPWMYLVFTVDPSGMNTARSDGKPLTDYSDRQYYKDVMDGKALAWQTLIGRTSKKPALVIGVPITSGETIIGVMAAAMTIDDISKSVARWKKGDTGFASLVDETGKVVAHQVEEYVTTQKNLKTHPLIRAHARNKKPVTMSFADEGGDLSLGHVVGIRYGWALAVQQAHDEVFETLKGVQRFAVILFVLTVILVTLIAWISAKSITRPIMRLTDAAERMSLGDLDVSIDIRSKDEIGHLARAFTRMQTSLRLAIGRLRHR
jgi:methyl-accepting chemotaxis protein